MIAWSENYLKADRSSSTRVLHRYRIRTDQSSAVAMDGRVMAAIRKMRQLMVNQVSIAALSRS
jgi:hypothetical protein